MDLKVGDPVHIDCVDGFYATGVIVAERLGIAHSRFKVHLDNEQQADFWAHNFELSYDSRPDTLAHINEVRALLDKCVADLAHRRVGHDASKLVDPEVRAFDTLTPKLRDSTYGSPEYEENRKALGAALAHHYAHNTHHPEHFADGVRGMNLLDVLEMLCDWKAATLRHADGDIRKSIDLNQARFGYSDELKTLLLNTLPLLEATT